MRPVTRRYEHLDFVAEKLFARITEKLFSLRVDQYDFTLVIDDHNRVRRRLQQVAEFLFGFFPLAAIADRAHAEHAFVSFDRAQADLNRKLDAILAQTI